MYLISTRGQFKSVRKNELRNDDTYVAAEEIIWDSFSTSLKNAFSLFKGLPRAAGKDGDATPDK
ncbi:hypothetical protein C2L65_42965 [Paraburkholderia terrae]|uniref:Uncharacterized protein n=1 Tax=Paraburkholderia terrae TaxID=311230 RepID=A0A2I8F3Y9_9BURK|nr:hypothetical protein C2L65_42965 [Paraburkholderia terrae]